MSLPASLFMFVFWLITFAILYHWLLFPALLYLRWRLRANSSAGTSGPVSSQPFVTVIVAVRNEEEVLPEKIANCLAQKYPADRIEFLFGSDASDDASDRILGRVVDPRFKWFRLDQRGGKVGVLNEALLRARGDLVLFTDADIVLTADCVAVMAVRFGDPKVGLVQASYSRNARDGSSGEGVFDRWENAVKFLESDAGALVSANGMAMMLRRTACGTLPVDTIHDDLLLGLSPFRAGLDAVFEPNAGATCRVEQERVEFGRRVKIGRGNMQALVRYRDLLSPRYGLKAWVLFSHKTLRALLPFAFPVLLVVTAFLSDGPGYFVFFCLQAVVYLTLPLVVVGRGRWKRFLLPQYFVFMNLALLWGSLLYLFGRRSGLWERTRRT